MNRIRETRKAKGLTQIEVAKYIGITQGGYSCWERGETRIDSASIARLAKLFEVSVDYLLGEADEAPKAGPFPVPDFTPEELAILAAYRRSDERTREIVRLALEPYGDFSKAKPATA